MAGALSVTDDLPRETGATIGHQAVEFVGVRSDSRGTRCQQQHGVVGRHATVQINAVETTIDGGGEGGLQLTCRDDGIGGDHA